jgi:RNA polymerase sigma-70 factor (ECF subfamily)
MKVIENIWNEYHNKLSAFIKSRVADDAADDILQDVFVKIHTRIESLQEGKKLESWLYQITRKTVKDYYLSKLKTYNMPDWIEQPQPEELEIIRQELSSCLAPMIEQLPDKYRLAVYQAEIEGKTQREVAEREGISVSGAKSRVQRGRFILKGMLHECCEFELNKNNQPIDYRKKHSNSDCC